MSRHRLEVAASRVHQVQARALFREEAAGRETVNIQEQSGWSNIKDAWKVVAPQIDFMVGASDVELMVARANEAAIAVQRVTRGALGRRRFQQMQQQQLMEASERVRGLLINLRKRFSNERQLLLLEEQDERRSVERVIQNGIIQAEEKELVTRRRRLATKLLFREEAAARRRVEEVENQVWCKLQHTEERCKADLVARVDCTTDSEEGYLTSDTGDTEILFLVEDIEEDSRTPSSHAFLDHAVRYSLWTSELQGGTAATRGRTPEPAFQRRLIQPPPASRRSLSEAHRSFSFTISRSSSAAAGREEKKRAARANQTDSLPPRPPDVVHRRRGCAWCPSDQGVDPVEIDLLLDRVYA
eukprot:Sspe_Gene.35115::Locus_17032_Transcript_1_1_Confidence_1.000_Length_1137::g.35115::m.35115